MRTIRKHFPSVKRAMAYRNRLYGKYEHVEPVESPRFSEGGYYSWRVG